MTKRTFKGFLKTYCAELSGLQTTNLRRLVSAADTDAPRVAEPLFCFALEEGKLGYLLGICGNTWMAREWARLAVGARDYPDAQSWLRGEPDLPDRYIRVLNAFESQDDLLKAERRKVGLMRKRTLAALGRSGMTRYAISRDLGVNKGNLYAWLAGDDSKVGMATARRVMEYVEMAV